MPSLDWIGKASVLNHHNEIPYRLVECNEVIGDLNAGNLIVKGDNLHALKALLPYYKGKVKMIYIDPPYNTGNSSWVYNDAMNAPEIKTWLDKTVDANDLSRSDKWLCMMYPRLKLLQEFLREDGAIFVSIDDAEAGHLRLILDSVFGGKNFVANIIWEKKYSPSNDAKWLSDSHDHIFVYGKNKDIWRPNLLQRSEKQNQYYKYDDNDGRGTWRSDNVLVKTFSTTGVFAITNPNTGQEYFPPKGSCYRFSESTAKRMLEENRFYFGKDGTGAPQLKRFLSEVKDGVTSKTIWFRDEVGDNQEAKLESNQILGQNLFDTPKPTRLIRRILEIATDKDDIVMDSFAGSGTTAHAVLAQNAMDGGNRKFILVEMEEYAKTITTERVRRVIEGYDFTGKDKTTLLEKKLSTAQILSADKMTAIAQEAQAVIDVNSEKYDKIDKEFKDNTLKIIGLNNISERKEGLGGGFRYCELGDGIIDENGGLNADVSAEALAKHLFFSEFGVPLETPMALPYIGSFRDVGLYLFFDKFERKRYATVTKDTHTSHIVYGISCTIDAMKLKDTGVIFRQLPFEIKER